MGPRPNSCPRLCERGSDQLLKDRQKSKWRSCWLHNEESLHNPLLTRDVLWNRTLPNNVEPGRSVSSRLAFLDSATSAAAAATVGPSPASVVDCGRPDAGEADPV